MMGAEAPVLFKDAPELTPRLGNRDLFSGLSPLVYMNHAGISPPSVLLRKAITTLLADYGKQGAPAYLSWSAQRDRLRGKIAKLIGAPDASVVALTQNTTRGISDIALCLDWKADDRVVLFDGEFPANVTPWQRAAATFGAKTVMLEGRRFVTDEGSVLADLETTLKAGRVRVVAVSAVQFQTGYRTPLSQMSRLCHDHGALLFVDAVQAVGMVPLDLVGEGADFIACGSHKWLMGLEGGGFLYASPTGASHLEPRVAGWLSHEDPVGFLFEGPGRMSYEKPIRKDVRFVEGGNLSSTAFAALEAALDATEKVGGVKTVFEHVQKVNDAIEGPAKDLGFVSARSEDPSRRSGSLCLLPPSGVDVVALYREITKQGVACATPDGYLRFSPHWPNAVDEADQVVLTLEHALGVSRQA